MIRLAAFAALLLVPVTSARADVFDEARRIDRATLGDLFWSAAVRCDEAQGWDDVQRRQCRALRVARARVWSGGTYVVRADGAAIVPGPAGQTVVRGCLACTAPVPVAAGDERYIVTRGSVSVEAGRVVGAEIARVPGSGKEVDLAFRLPPSPEAWTQGEQHGYFVELVAWRFINPAPPPKVAPAEPPLPEVLTSEDIRSVMRGVGDEVDVCFESHGVPGTADLNMEIGGDGTVLQVEIRGELADTPTAQCIIAAVKKASFPRFKRRSMWIHHPFILR